jgi:hypothetical protein
MQENITNRGYAITNLEVSPKVRRPSQSMKNILKKTPVYENSFLKLRDVELNAVVNFDEVTGEPRVDVFFPADIHADIVSGKIQLDQAEFARTCRQIAGKMVRQKELAKNPTRVYHKA